MRAKLSSLNSDGISFFLIASQLTTLVVATIATAALGILAAETSSTAWSADTEEEEEGEEVSNLDTYDLMLRTLDAMSLQPADLILAGFIGVAFYKLLSICDLLTTWVLRERSDGAQAGEDTTTSITLTSGDESKEEEEEEVVVVVPSACAKGVNVTGSEPPRCDPSALSSHLRSEDNRGDCPAEKRQSEGAQRPDIFPLIAELRDELDKVKGELLMEERVQGMQQRVKSLVQHDSDLSWWPEEEEGKGGGQRPFKWLRPSRGNLRTLKRRLQELNRKINILKAN